MFRTLMSAGILAAGAALPVLAQDYVLAPTYGTLELSAGFAGDPRTVELQSGGSIAASNAAGGCSGYIADAPDVRVNYEAGSLYPLILSVEAAADTTLVINAPDGAWYCDDDSGEGLNPSVRFNSPISGQYDIWVGTFDDASLHRATLYVSETSSR